MKNKFLAQVVAVSLIALLVAGCGAVKTKSESSDMREGGKPGQSKFDVDFEWYTRGERNVDELENGHKSYSVSACMQKYFLAYGARDIRYCDFDDQIDIVIEFKNGILFGMQFHKVDDSGQTFEIGGNAGYFILSVSDDEYHPDFFQDIDSSRTEEHSEYYHGKPFWYREFDDLRAKYVTGDIEELNRDYIKTIYAYDFDEIRQKSGAIWLCFPGYFDDFFRNSVVPYLELEAPSKDVDPLKDNKDLDGHYFNMQYVKVPNSDRMTLKIDTNAE